MEYVRRLANQLSGTFGTIYNYIVHSEIHHAILYVDTTNEAAACLADRLSDPRAPSHWKTNITVCRVSSAAELHRRIPRNVVYPNMTLPIMTKSFSSYRTKTHTDLKAVLCLYVHDVPFLVMDNDVYRFFGFGTCDADVKEFVLPWPTDTFEQRYELLFRPLPPGPNPYDDDTTPAYADFPGTDDPPPTLCLEEAPVYELSDSLSSSTDMETVDVVIDPEDVWCTTLIKAIQKVHPTFTCNVVKLANDHPRKGMYYPVHTGSKAAIPLSDIARELEDDKNQTGGALGSMKFSSSRSDPADPRIVDVIVDTDDPVDARVLRAIARGDPIKHFSGLDVRVIPRVVGDSPGVAFVPQYEKKFVPLTQCFSVLGVNPKLDGFTLTV